MVETADLPVEDLEGLGKMVGSPTFVGILFGKTYRPLSASEMQSLANVLVALSKSARVCPPEKKDNVARSTAASPRGPGYGPAVSINLYAAGDAEEILRRGKQLEGIEEPWGAPMAQILVFDRGLGASVTIYGRRWKRSYVVASPNLLEKWILQ